MDFCHGSDSPVSDTQWVAVSVLAPFGGRDRVVLEFDAPNKKAAAAEYARRVERKEVEPGLAVMARVEYDNLNASVTQSRLAHQREKDNARFRPGARRHD